jgi:hypothetical protein
MISPLWLTTDPVVSEKPRLSSTATKPTGLTVLGAFLAVGDGTSHSAGQCNKEVRHEQQQT